MKIAKPNYTQIPNAILDAIHELKPADVKVVIVICRETFGWHKERVPISLSQLVKKTGLSNMGVRNSIDSLMGKGWLIRTPDGQSFAYEIAFEPCKIVAQSEEDDPAKELHSTMQNSCTVPCKIVAQSEAPHINNKERLKEKKERDRLAEQIYQAYPLKVGKPKALKAILSAMEETPGSEILEKTIAFAEARSGDLEFCPHPTTWFNQRRFNDDPRTWKRATIERSTIGSGNPQRDSGRIGPGEQRNRHIIGAESTRAAIRAEQANPEPAPWDEYLQPGISGAGHPLG